jgi:hypothetical protein
MGGQTGSLIPCIPRSFGNVPAGDGAFVGYTSDCEGLRPPDDFRLADASGNVIELTPVELGGGNVLFRAEQALPPGRYTVNSEGTSFERELVVTEAEALPLALGSLTFVEGSGCPPAFTLELDAAVLPYKALLKLSVAVDGGAPSDWVRFGELASTSAEGPLSLELPCPRHCLARGRHQLVLSGEIAGETLDLAPLALAFDATCNEADGVACALSAPRRHGLPGFLLGVLALVSCVRARRRRR